MKTYIVEIDGVHLQIRCCSDGRFIIPDGWRGIGSALKPANEPICLARKPIEGTIADNVLTHGTGALNVDGCRVGTEDTRSPASRTALGMMNDDAWLAKPVMAGSAHGRFPANIIHDGSDEVVSAFPSEAGAFAPVKGTEPSERTSGIYGKMRREGEASANRRYTDNGGTNFAALPGARRIDSGSAARFFYTAKADADDRLGSKHPTIKPVDLMQYLVRLVTRKGGVVLDPFAGTGTTGEAAWREGMKAILVEREPEYQADIARRMELAANPTKRAAVAKTKNNLDDPSKLPLFARTNGDDQ